MRPAAADVEELFALETSDAESSSGHDEWAAPRGDAAAVTDPETWMDYWSEELLTLWHLVQDQCAANGYAILDRCTVSDFTDFCFRRSSGRPPAA